MNKSKITLLGSLILVFGGLMPLSSIAQEARNESGEQTVKTQAVPVESTVAKVGDKVLFSPRSLRSASPSAEFPPAAKKRSAPSGAYDWTGGYIGGQIGYGSGRGDTQFDPLPSAATFINLRPTTLTPDPTGWTGGLQGGFNGQFGHFVIGGETSFSWSNVKGTQTQTPIVQNNGTPFPGAGFITTTHDIEWFGTLRAKAGVAIDRVFIYGTGGLAYAKINYSANTDFRPTGTTQYPAALAQTNTGWTGGFGAEIGINRHWSWRTEYLYFDLGNASATVNATPALPPFQLQYTFRTQAHTFNTGFNFRF